MRPRTRLAAVLSAGERHLAATGAPTNADGTRTASVVKRLAKEAALLVEKPIDNVVFVQEPWPDAPSDFHNERWHFHVRGQYEIVVEFPKEYPFKPPEYKIRVDHLWTDGKLMGVKKYLHRAAEGSPHPHPAFAAAYEHILAPEMMRRLAVDGWSPALFAREFVAWLAADAVLQPVLMYSPSYVPPSDQ
jgi:hypothetical protein